MILRILVFSIESLWQHRFRRPDFSPRLTALQAFLDAQGNPEKKLSYVVQVAGTNGKGSTVQFLASIFQASGYTVHCYTSPHLMCWTERIRVRGRCVPYSELYDVLKRISYHTLGRCLTPFEALTAAAIYIFSKNPADIILCEVGLGGQHDATCVMPASLSIITPIGWDHCEVLGPSLSHIAQAKAGIMRSNVPCVVAPQPQGRKVEDVLRHHASQRNTPLYIGRMSKVGASASAGEWVGGVTNNQLWVQDMWPHTFPLPKYMKGQYQYINALTALMGVYHSHKSYTIQTLREGIRKARWTGRCQRICTSAAAHYFPCTEVWVDGAHNIDGLTELVKEFDAATTLFVWGVLQRKNPENCRYIWRNKHVYLATGWDVESWNHSFPEFLGHGSMQNLINHFKCPYKKIVFCGSLVWIGHILSWLRTPFFCGQPSSLPQKLWWRGGLSR